MPKIYKRTLAKNDLVECYVYLAENVSIDIGRFQASCRLDVKF